MNLLLLISALECGGAETHVCTLARALRRRGHTVTVASAGGTLAERLTREGISHQTVPLHSPLPHRLLLARHRLNRLLRENDYTLIHAHSRIAAFVASPLAKRKRIPLVTTVHARFRATPLLRRLSRWGTRPIAVSEDLKHYLCETYGVAPHRITVIPNGIELPTPAQVPTADKPQLVFCSRLDSDCAHAAFLLCQIAPRLRESFPDLELLLIGGGDALPALKRQAEQVNHIEKAPVVRCVGALTDPSELLRAARAVVGVSRVALEAMALGVPVILAGNEGFGGVAEPNGLSRAASTNFCCRGEPPVTEDKLYDACVRLLSMTDGERARLGACLSEYVQTHHGMEHVAAETEAVYREALQALPPNTCGETVLCGYYGYGNMGDDALLSSAIRRAKQTDPAHSLSALTKNGKKDEPNVGVRCVRRVSLSAVRELRNAQTLVFGGGTLLQDLTSLRSLCYYAAIIRYAKRHGARVELWANGIQAPTTDLGGRVMQAALRRCDYIGLRDRPSMALAKELLGEEAPVFYEQDLALPTPAASPERVAFLLHHAKLSEHFAVIAPKGRTGKGVIKALSSRLCALRADGIQPVFVPLYPKEDTLLCRRLAVHENDRVIIGLSPSDLVGLMEKSEVVCGMRLHALIFAASAHTPFVGFGTDPKLQAFCHEHGGVYFTEL